MPDPEARGELVGSKPKPKGNRALWLWLAGVYLSLMLPVAAVLVLVAVKKNGGVWSPEAFGLAFYIFILPAWAWLGYIVTWYMGAVLYFLAWKYAELLQWITGIPLGQWAGQNLARDRFLRHAPQSGPYGWLYRKVIERYPHENPQP